MRGRVVEFDDAKGYGTVEGDDGRFFFHCTAIADGSRSISVGAEVDYEVSPGHQGRWEAKRLSPPAASP
jgi:cold shock CspA family protein